MGDASGVFYRPVVVVCKHRVQLAALGIDHELAVADRAMQQILVAVFDARFADVGGARIFAAIDASQIFSADAAHIAHGVGGGGTKGVMSGKPSANIDTGKVLAAHGELGDLFITEPGAQGHGLEAPLGADQLADAIPL